MRDAHKPVLFLAIAAGILAAIAVPAAWWGITHLAFWIAGVPPSTWTPAGKSAEALLLVVMMAVGLLVGAATTEDVWRNRS